MSAGSEIRAGRAYVEMSLQDKFSKQLDATAKKLKSFGESLAKIGAVAFSAGAGIIAPLTGAAIQFASMGDQLNKASQRTGIAVEALSELKYAAEQSDLSFEELEGSIRKMEKAIFEAENGSKSAREALASIGLTVKQLRGLTPDQQFEKIADGLNRIKDPGAKAAVAMEVFGKSGTALLPLMADGAAGIRQLRQQAEQLGLVISKEDAEAATLFGDTLDDLWKQIKAMSFQVGAAVANALQPFAGAARNVTATIIRWTSEHRSLVLAVLAGGAAIAVAGASLVTLGVVMAGVVVAVNGASAAFGLVATGVGLLVNPIVLVVGALAGLTGYLIYTSSIGEWMSSSLRTSFGKLLPTISSTLNGISNALTAGNLSLAAQIAGVGIHVAFLQAVNPIRNTWSEVMNWIVKKTVDGLAEAARAVVKGIQAIVNLNPFSTASDKAAAVAFGYLMDAQIEGMKRLAKIGSDLEKDNKIKDRIKELEDLKNKLAALNGQALTEKEEKIKSSSDRPGKPSNLFDIDIDGLLRNRAAIQSPAKAAGVFNSQGIQALQGGGPAVDYLRRTAIATEDTARNSRKTLKFR